MKAMLHTKMFLLFLIPLVLHFCFGYVPNGKCSINVTGVGNLNGNLYEVLCSVSKQECDNLPIDAENNNKPHLQFGPCLLHGPCGWYLHHDNKLALKIAWRPSHDDSLKYLRGYRVSITDQTSNPSKAEVYYYCFHTDLEYNKHVLAVFSLETYGLDSGTHVSPGSNFQVNISSLPYHENDRLVYEIEVPSCSDSDVLSRSQDCAVQKLLTVVVFNACCPKLQYSYQVPREYGISANFLLCKYIDDDQGQCSQKVMWAEEQLNSSHSTHTIPPEYCFPGSNYTLHVMGSSNQKLHNKTDFTFDSCTPNVKLLLTAMGVIILTALIALLLYRWYCQRKKLADEERESGALLFSGDASNVDSASHTKRVMVYVIFVNDHPKHRDVVKEFANYLQKDLGFHVIFELWERHIAAINYTAWMDECLEKADKIIVIWSPGAARLWNGSQIPNLPDIFTPVVRRIHEDLFLNRDRGKYFFAYFSYCGETGTLDEEISRHISRTFQLMDQFKELYFQLCDSEIFMPGEMYQLKKADKDCYFDPDINEMGPSLKRAIDEMSAISQNNPDWHRITSQLPDTQPLGDSDVIFQHPLMTFPPPSLEESGVVTDRSHPDLVPIDHESDPMLQILRINKQQA